MKFKLTVLLTVAVVAMGLLLGTSAVTAQEQTIEVNPVNRGEQAVDLTFDVDLPGANDIDLVFTDNKTLEFGPGPLGFMFSCVLPNCAVEGFSYNGSLLDASRNEILGTAFSGKLDVDAADVNLVQPTAWSGMRFKGSFTPGPYLIIWIGIPYVGTGDQLTLTVNKSGEGSGSVTSVPSGIDCGNTCSTDFDNGTSVTLTATPDEGSELTSWSGCDQTQANTCTVSMTAARTVTVTFAEGAVDPEMEVITDDAGNVIQILNLEVIDEQTGEINLHQVDFVYDTAINVYGQDLDYDFPNDEDVILALEAVLDALNLNEPIPVAAGPQGSDQFFIGNKTEDGLVAAFGGQNFVGIWDQCDTDCVAGVAVLAPNAPVTYADFSTGDYGLDTGYTIDFQSQDQNLWIRAVINTEEMGPIDAVWRQGGQELTERGDEVVWGLFYASPDDVTWGSRDNPDLYVKIWFDVDGRLDVNFFHVSVPDIEVYSAFPAGDTADQQGTTTMTRRYIRQYYENGQSFSDGQDEDGMPASGYTQANNPLANDTINRLAIGSSIISEEMGPIDALWFQGGTDTTERGDQVVWGFFYANPEDVSWGSGMNPDLFVKIWFDHSGRIDVNFFHVSVPDIEVYSDYPVDGTYDQSGTTVLADRYIRQEYTRVADPNAPPVADAGPDQSIVDADNSGDEAVTLDGSASTDLDGMIVSWSWKVNGVEFGTGETLTVGVNVGVYTVTLTVTDDEGATDTDDVVINVVAGSVVNEPPVADAGPTQSIVDADDSGDQAVTLDGSASTDADGLIVSWDWTSASAGPIGTGETLNWVFDVGEHTVTLIVTDDQGATDTDDLTVRVVPAGANVPPVADAGPDQVVVDADDNGWAAVTLDGSASTDADGTIVGWKWNEGSGVLGFDEVLDTELWVSAGAVATAHEIGLVVTDDQGATDTDEVLIIVRIPTIEGVVGYQRDNYEGEATLLSGDVSDLRDLPGPCVDNWDDCISSIKVPDGWSATLFELDGFEGDSLVVVESIPNLDNIGGTDWDNRTSSIKVGPPN